MIFKFDYKETSITSYKSISQLHKIHFVYFVYSMYYSIVDAIGINENKNLFALARFTV
jgi:hypothetical protein